MDVGSIPYYYAAAALPPRATKTRFVVSQSDATPRAIRNNTVPAIEGQSFKAREWYGIDLVKHCSFFSLIYSGQTAQQAGKNNSYMSALQSGGR